MLILIISSYDEDNNVIKEINTVINQLCWRKAVALTLILNIKDED